MHVFRVDTHIINLGAFMSVIATALVHSCDIGASLVISHVWRGRKPRDVPVQCISQHVLKCHVAMSRWSMWPCHVEACGHVTLKHVAMPR
jgi:hypothetical protein